MDCEQIRDYLPAFDEGNHRPAVAEHLQGCEQCRTRLQQYRELRQELSSLAGYEVTPPAWLQAAVMEGTLERLHRTAALRAASRQLGEHRGVAAGGALLLAGVAGAAIFAKGRHRKRVGLAPPAVA